MRTLLTTSANLSRMVSVKSIAYYLLIQFSLSHLAFWVYTESFCCLTDAGKSMSLNFKSVFCFREYILDSLSDVVEKNEKRQE